MSVFKRVSREKIDWIEEKLERFLWSRDWKSTFRLRSLDEDEGIKNIIEFFEMNSTIKGSVDNATIYIIPVYYYNHYLGSVYVMVAFLVVKRDSSGYTVGIDYRVSKSFDIQSEEEAEEYAEKRYGGFIRLLKKALETKHPNTTKLAELIVHSKWFRTISFLEKIYGDEILSDDTIPGIHSVFSIDTNFFINDKIVVISPDLLVVRDRYRDKIFVYNSMKDDFYEIPLREKIFFKALFEKYRDLLEPDVEIETPNEYEYALSSSSTVVDGKKVSLIAVRWRDSKKKNRYRLHDVFAITCDEHRRDRCSIYSFSKRVISEDIDVVEKRAPYFIEKIFPRYIIGSEKIHAEAKGELAKYLTEKYEWEILPA